MSPPRRPESKPARDQRTLGQIKSQNHESKEAARFKCVGGLFCDDPGLGKTITAWH